MTIKYFLVDNPLTPDPNDMRAQVVNSGNKDLSDIINECLRRGTLVTETDMKAVCNLLFDVMTDFAAEGYNIVTPLCNVRTLIKGVFADNDTPFNAADHEIKPSLSPGLQLRTKYKTATVEKTKASKHEPIIQSFFDQKTGLKNAEFTAGGMGMLSGSDLSFDQADAAQGIFFIDSAGTETAVSDYLETKPGKISFSIPVGLTPDTYTLELRSTMGSSSMRTATLQGLEIK